MVCLISKPTTTAALIPVPCSTYLKTLNNHPIIETLGFIADASAIDSIIAFIEQGNGNISAQAFRAKNNGLLALGYLINKNPQPKALNYLFDSLNINAWRLRNIIWNTVFSPTPQVETYNWCIKRR